MAPKKTQQAQAQDQAQDQAQAQAQEQEQEQAVEQQAQEPEAAAAVVVQTSSTVPAAVSCVYQVIEVINQLTKAHKDTAQSLKDATSLLKQLQKDIAQLQKDAAAKSKRGRKSGGGGGASAAEDGGAATPRKPSGFVKPSPLSDELRAFLGVPEGTLLSRTSVTHTITDYIKEHKLFDEADKRTIKPDEKLKNLLSVKDGVKITYFNLQTHIKQHFLKEGDNPPATPADAA